MKVLVPNAATSILVAGVLMVLPFKARSQQQAEYTPSYLALLEEAEREYRRENLDAALAVLRRADAIMHDTAAALNLRGSIASSQQDYEKAKGYFERAVEKSPDFFAAQFNLGEILFMQREYDAARRHFLKMLEIQPKNELLNYKVFFTYLMEADDAKATEWLEKIKYPGDSPAYYFARAGWEFKHANPEEARSWVKESLRVFSAQKNQYFIESLSELGWLDRSIFR